MSQSMVTTAQESEDGHLALLEAREREMARKLIATQAEIAELRARYNALAHPVEGQRLALDSRPLDILPALAPGEKAATDGDSAPSSRPFIMLQPLAAQDPLRAKWQLGSGTNVPASAPVSGQTLTQALARSSGSLRLFGLVDDGQPWECRVPFARIALEGGIILGRSANSADVVVKDSSVSRRHACMELTDEGLVITDLGSTNGLRIDERRLYTYERQVPLHDGATIALGEARLRIEIIP